MLRHLELSWIQCMTMTSVMPCHALHPQQHAAVSPFRPLNQSNEFLRPNCRCRFYITGKDKPGYAGFCLELPTLDGMPTRASALHLP